MFLPFWQFIQYNIVIFLRCQITRGNDLEQLFYLYLLTFDLKKKSNKYQIGVIKAIIVVFQIHLVGMMYTKLSMYIIITRKI